MLHWHSLTFFSHLSDRSTQKSKSSINPTEVAYLRIERPLSALLVLVATSKNDKADYSRAAEQFIHPLIVDIGGQPLRTNEEVKATFIENGFGLTETFLQLLGWSHLD
ncbi:MAG: hypothetical protein SNI42_02300 [Rikenellaceae bacterium]